jgi:WS/DGAT/MGAT family acyltransferase
MKPLSGMDASFLYMETPSQLAHVVGTIILDPSAGDGFSYERMVEVLRNRMHLLEPFRRRLVTVPLNLGHPVWIEDADFDLESHIHRVAVRPPGTMRELAEIVADIAGLPLDRTRPLWDLTLIEGLEDGKVGFVTKMHHAAIDGVTGADLMAHLFDLAPDAPDPEPPGVPWTGEAVPSDLELMARAMQGVASRPRTMAKVLGRRRPTIAQAPRSPSPHRE